MSIGLTGKDDGTTPPTGANGVGVHGTSSAGAGVAGESGSSYGVHGTSLNGVGVFGESVLQTAPGVTATVVGVLGRCLVGTAVRGDRLLNTGLTIPLSTNYASGFLAGDDPVFGLRAGVYGESDQQGVMGIGGIHGSTGVYGNTKTGDGFGVRGETTTGTAIWGRSLGSGLAGSFIGNVQVIGRFVGNVEFAGDVLLSGGDCAEKFRVAPATVAEPGTVMVIQNDGLIRPCSREMDPTVAGVVSGAGGLKAAIVLDYEAGPETVPIALTGKVFVKVDADVAAISAGDLLVTSSTLGHAMRLPPELRDRGAMSGLVLGKALSSLRTGRGLIPMLVTLS